MLGTTLVHLVGFITKKKVEYVMWGIVLCLYYVVTVICLSFIFQINIYA
jgi:hypothetical protein